jgi:hypothetical protein
MAGFAISKKPKQQPMSTLPPSAQGPSQTLPAGHGSTGQTQIPTLPTATGSMGGGATAGFGVRPGSGVVFSRPAGGPVMGGGFGGMMPNFGGPPPGINISAQNNPALEALQARYDKYLNGLEANSGQIMDQAGSRLRDAREGGLKTLTQTQGLRGVASSPATAKYEADTQRGVQSAIADITTDRERTLGAALTGGLGIARAPGEMALAEKGLGINAFQAQSAANMQQFQAWLALLNAQRDSPMMGSGGGYYSGGF